MTQQPGFHICNWATWVFRFRFKRWLRSPTMCLSLCFLTSSLQQPHFIGGIWQIGTQGSEQGSDLYRSCQQLGFQNLHQEQCLVFVVVVVYFSLIRAISLFSNRCISSCFSKQVNEWLLVSWKHYMIKSDFALIHCSYLQTLSVTWHGASHVRCRSLVFMSRLLRF